MYSIFGHTMSYGRIYLVFLVNTWLIVAIEMIWSRWYDWRVIKMAKQRLVDEQENKLLMENNAGLSDMNSDI